LELWSLEVFGLPADAVALRKLLINVDQPFQNGNLFRVLQIVLDAEINP
jgi:hypothetical protein